MRTLVLISSLSVAAVLGACAPSGDVPTRSDTDPLGFEQSGNAARIEDHAVTLTQMGDQLVRHSLLEGDAQASANELERSIRGLHGQMEVLELSLPVLMEGQSAALSELQVKRRSGALTRDEFDQGAAQILQSRTRLSEALDATITQTQQANYNMLDASFQGQSGLDWHMGATAELARNAQTVRTAITPLEPVKRPRPKLVNHVVRSGVLR